MIKKFICIVICMLLFATTVAVTGTKNTIDNNKIETRASESIIPFRLPNGKMAYGQCLQSTNRDLVTFDLTAPSPWTVVGPGTSVGADFLS